MNLRPLLVFLASLTVINATAAVIDVSLRYKEIRLKNGTLFSDVMLKNFNPTAETAMLVGKREMHSIPTYLLPDDIAAKLKSLTPVRTKEEQAAERNREADARTLALRNLDRQPEQSEVGVQAARDAAREANLRAAAKADAQASNLLAAVAQAAEDRARNYFKHEDDPHSNIGYVTNVDLTMNEPEAVPGWGGRYRVTGTAYRQDINNRASGFGRATKNFEVLIDTAENQKPKVIDLTVKL